MSQGSRHPFISGPWAAGDPQEVSPRIRARATGLPAEKEGEPFPNSNRPSDVHSVELRPSRWGASGGTADGGLLQTAGSGPDPERQQALADRLCGLDADWGRKMAVQRHHAVARGR
jgi:hypothetical protein